MENGLGDAMYKIETERLGLRLWKDSDKAAFAKMNADIAVMQYMPKLLIKAESDAFADRIMAHFEDKGYGLFAVEEKVSGEFIGFIGFYTAAFISEFTPCAEIGWRLDKAYWHKGYATEGAKACLKYGMETLDFNEIYSFTSEINKSSINVMEKIGLVKKQTFRHPNLEDVNPLKPHVLYYTNKKIYAKTFGL